MLPLLPPTTVLTVETARAVDERAQRFLDRARGVPNAADAVSRQATEGLETLQARGGGRERIASAAESDASSSRLSLPRDDGSCDNFPEALQIEGLAHEVESRQSSWMQTRVSVLHPREQLMVPRVFDHCGKSLRRFGPRDVGGSPRFVARRADDVSNARPLSLP